MATKKIRISKYHEWDYYLVLVTFILSLGGIVLAFSASYYTSMSKYGTPYRFLEHNLVWYALGWFLLLVFARIDYHVLKHFAIPAIVIGLGLLVLLLLPLPICITINNATRWLGYKNVPITIMPGELIKPAIILFFASLFSSKPEKIKGVVMPILLFGLLGVIFLLIFKEPNLSTACIVVLLGAALMFIAGLNWIWVFLAGGGAAAGILFLVVSKSGYMLTRIKTAFDPWADPLGSGYQVVQSLLALGSGGVLGKGLGDSIQKTLYLPEPQSDFILPIIGEEIGYVGLLVILAFYVVLFARLISVSLRAKDRFGSLLAAGTAVLLALHVILNVLVVTATFPPTGVFLPFMSQGGNATLVFLVLIGISLNVSRQAYVAPEKEEEPETEAKAELTEGQAI
ncbi:MAG: FtsW/RodA/SpoVE family cell cycle protein [Firmicutes bacterium]|nr:FtsW/RodA/SpoVE family cell cycle protein [Bacillota bacterium]MBR5925882.1 FtsW/RodA/SpoVE family cell cycle protein [Bacillota bacterium]MBR6025615.1 FtsW/RodA/SpoVE family cell cycle protein [Bacillota bacterium]